MRLKLKIGVTSWKSESGWSADALCSQAEIAESIGCHSFWLPENHFGDQRSMPSPLTLLAAVSGRTARIKLGTVSYLLPIRHPLLAAEEVAVLDQLSGGRVILGVGRGIQAAVFNAFDLPSKDKRKRFGENLDLMRRAWAGEPVAQDDFGEPVCLAPLPVQRPHPPIWVAAFGPLALQQVGNLGLPYLASPIETLETLRGNYQQYRAIVSDAGHTVVNVVPIMRTVFVCDDSTVVNSIRSSLEKVSQNPLGERPSAVDDWAIVGDRSYVCDKLAEYQETLGVTHLIASGRLPGVASEAIIGSHQLLLECVG
jgi:alkanesulfonate monooxygenase SsuD/methylene tetrahydromethanopterin reductase-like flavin-dependent oxidoreductase (luciferase family)